MTKKIKLYSYLLTHDSGFAPNPFYEYCTLACCKPQIRKNIGRRFALEKDNSEFWVLGISYTGIGSPENKLIYAMRVDEVLTFDKYFSDIRFKEKKPDWKSANSKEKAGDNIYKYNGTGDAKKVESYYQLESQHNNEKTKNDPKKNSLFHKKRDLLKGEFYVLISQEYYYFGKKPEKLNASLECLYKAPSGKHIRQKWDFSEKTIQDFAKYLFQIKKKYKNKRIINNPLMFKESNPSH